MTKQISDYSDASKSYDTAVKMRDIGTIYKVL